MKQTLFLTAAMICLLFSACKKENNGGDVTLPLTIDFTDQASVDNAKGKGLLFSRLNQDWRKDGNCSKLEGKANYEQVGLYLGLLGKDYLSYSTAICNISKIKNLQRIRLKMTAKDAWDYDTMQPLTSAAVTLCNGSGMVIQVDTAKSSVRNQSGNLLSQEWEIAVNGQSAERLSISSDDAAIYSVTFE